jgi:hypothetical protein
LYGKSHFTYKAINFFPYKKSAGASPKNFSCKIRSPNKPPTAKNKPPTGTKVRVNSDLWWPAAPKHQPSQRLVRISHQLSKILSGSPAPGGREPPGYGCPRTPETKPPTVDCGGGAAPGGPRERRPQGDMIQGARCPARPPGAPYRMPGRDHPRGPPTKPRPPKKVLRIT